MSDATNFFQKHQEDLAYALAFLVIFCALFILMNGISSIASLCRCWSEKVLGRGIAQGIEDTEVGLKDSKHSVHRSLSSSTADTIGAAEGRGAVAIRQIPRTEETW